MDEHRVRTEGAKTRGQRQAEHDALQGERPVEIPEEHEDEAPAQP